MLNFDQFPPPPSVDTITACEIEGRLKALPSVDAAQTIAQWLGSSNVEIVIGQESARPAHSKFVAREAFTAHTENAFQRLSAAYYEDGLIAAIDQLSSESDDVPSGVKHFASLILKMCNSVTKYFDYFPSLYASKHPPLNQSISVNVGSISSICWHPHTTTVAVVFSDDTIRVFGKGQSLTPLLKHRMQKNISEIQWMPNYISMLAVGCSSGILLWTLDPVSIVVRPSGSSLTHLRHLAITPVSSLSYHPKGLYLACVGGEGRCLVIFDTVTEVSQTVFSGVATALSHVLWSPDGSRLLVATRSNAIRVFETRTWSSERWSLEHPLQSAAWSSCGQNLLFSTAGESTLFALYFEPSTDGTVGGARVASSVADLSRQAICSEDGEEVSISGRVSQLCWDSTSERLAIVFEDSEYICLMHTIVSPQLHVAPGGFLKGSFEQLPVYCQFQNNVTNGSILTVIWSDSKVTHLPFRYTMRSNQRHNDAMHNYTGLNHTLNNTMNHTLNHSLHHASFRQNVITGHSFSTPTTERNFGDISLFTSPITANLFTSPS